MILYEHPFNESIRTMLRLEHLFERLQVLVARDSAIDHHHAIAALFEIMDVAARADLKSDVLKDLERHKAQLVHYRGNPAISEAALEATIGSLERAYQALNALPGKAGQQLTTNEWLMSIRSRISIPGGTCEFDLPAYYAWQHEDAEQRRSDLQRWAATLMPLADALATLLQLLRDSGHRHMVVANAGLYQQSLQAGRTFQLMRVRLPVAARLVPEISGHRLLVSIRLMRADAEGRLRAAIEDASFELTLCA